VVASEQLLDEDSGGIPVPNACHRRTPHEAAARAEVSFEFAEHESSEE
jgi:hypothetical protein